MDPKEGTDIPTSMFCNGFDARVRVDGKDVPHYAIEVDEEKKEVVCWIASETGKPFTMVVTKVSPKELQSSLLYYVDGNQVAAYAVLDTHAGKTVTATGVDVSSTERRALLFSEMEFTDDDSLLEASQSTKIGEIKIVVEEATFTKDTAPPCTFSLPDTGKLHERAKKGLNHQVKLGASIPIPSTSRSYRTTVLGILATFYFRYRPLAMLQANGLTPHAVPKDAPPPPSTGKRGRSEADEDKGDANDEDEDDEVVEVTYEEEERRLLEQLEKVRQKKLESARSRKKIKTEEKTYFTPGEVIDLT